jgi:Fe-S-cluster-containing dehydrogenase component
MPVDLSGGTKNVIKLYKEADSPRRSYFKAQCMHCVDPACTSACMLGSIKKDPKTGVVGYSPEYCVGCRYCSMACPYEICRFQFDEAAPKIVKCELCRHRVKDEAKMTASGYTRYPEGQGPACAEVCPRGAVIYGRRDELLAEAKRRIAAHPERYVGYAEGDPARVFGETDGGGTQVLYLAHVPFEKLGLPDLGTQAVPHTANVVQEGIYKGFIAPVALYAVLAGVLLRNRKSAESGPEKGGTP